MTDSPESSPRRRLTSAQIASHLQYPTFPPLTASVEEWVIRSRPTNMTSDQPPDHPPNSLSDSWATLSVSDIHSEDGSHSEQTDTCSLIDQTTPDDVASLDERYSSSEAEVQDEDNQEDDGIMGDEIPCSASVSQQLPTLFPFTRSTIDDSTTTTKPTFPNSSDSIEFVEPEKWPEIERVELKHTIRIFDGAAAEELKSRLPFNSTDSILMATVQQTMTKQSLDLDKPFRVLYVGQPEFRNIILDKIGDVLVSSSCASSETSSAESSRYHVVPTSFGAGAVPNFAELLPIHVQLVVDECVEATADPSVDRPNTLSLKFKNRAVCTSAWNGSDYRVSSASDWTLPDVAIIFVSGRDDTKAINTQYLTHAFLERHGIPAMMISEEPLWNMAGETIPLNHSSLHTCLESRHPESGETAVLRRYPIDLKTFESITPGQLNRNLASLVGLYSKKAHKVTAEASNSFQTTLFAGHEKYLENWLPSSYATRVREWAPTLRLVALTLISAIILSIGYATVKVIVVFLAQCIAGSALSNAFPPASSQISSFSVPPLDRVSQTSVSIQPSSSVQILHVPPVGVSIPNEITGPALSAPGPANADEFEIQTVGDCHVIIKPSFKFTTSKKQPRFNVSVQRQSKDLPYELSQLFEGVYMLKLDREDAYGLIDVTITTQSKVPINQTMAVDFGTPWLKIASWKRAAQGITSQFTKDLQMAQTGLTEVYGRFSTDLQVVMGDVVKRTHILRRDAENLRRDSLTTRDTVLSRSKQISEVFTRNALQRFRTASSVLQLRSSRANKEAKELVHDAWSRIGESAAKVDLRSMMDRVRNARKCEALDRAQSRARHILGLDSAQ
ncbi:uncharacterized protein N7446_001909 [Penicillium canescens]|uniref:Uncharacterized protein n=1 Tax=Penicillium canescens TaxID=5083 RepID=A0AAD6IE91_PENCN|nr:uncharacterized protein N7446_001909 [Penicillium canescens]KAJ6043713.1 hypothetical protein N7460_005068 [Penicillium canescens]KAJ6055185.1 hypothetical protein N7444_004283 [Penicillium canescens]KAJ6074132.1 hypothetical protein N7446_001909 [Penicillium canescens]